MGKRNANPDIFVARAEAGLCGEIWQSDRMVERTHIGTAKTSTKLHWPSANSKNQPDDHPFCAQRFAFFVGPRCWIMTSKDITEEARFDRNKIKGIDKQSK